MPRDGSGIYTLPFPDVAPSTTIESTVYNGFTSDVAIDLNAPRPIIAGGTGATNPNDALFNMSGEKAAQVVTNYDSQVWYPGSFRAASTATNPPVAGHAFAGVVYINEPLANPPTNQNVTVEARDLDDTQIPGRHYVRQKKAGVWGPWKLDDRTIIGDAEGIAGDAADMFFGVKGTAPTSKFIVNTESDVTGTDALKVTKDGITTLQRVDGNASLVLNKTASGKTSDISFTMADKLRWLLRGGNEVAEAGADVGSDFALYRYNDAGTTPALAMSIERKTGNLNTGNLVIAKADPAITLQKAASGQIASISSYLNATQRWSIILGDNAPESGGNTGSDFALYRCTDAGATAAPAAIHIGRNNGAMTLGGDLHWGPSAVSTLAGADGTLTATNTITCNGAASPVIGFTVAGAAKGYFQWDNANTRITCNLSPTIQPLHITASGLSVFTEVRAQGATAGGSCGMSFYNSAGGFRGGALYSGASDYCSFGGAAVITYLQAGNINVIKADTPTAQMYMWGTTTNWWSQSGSIAVSFGTVYKPGGGPWTDSSDARIKNVLGDYTTGLAEIVALAPKRFTYKGNDVRAPIPVQDPNAPGFKGKAVEPGEPDPNSGHYQSAIDGREFIGLIAQEVETAMPEMVTQVAGTIDSVPVTDLRDLDTTALVYALINAVKELAARVEQLEAVG